MNNEEQIADQDQDHWAPLLRKRGQRAISNDNEIRSMNTHQIAEQVKLCSNPEYVQKLREQSRLNRKADKVFKSLKHLFKRLEKKVTGLESVEKDVADPIQSVIDLAERLEAKEIQKLEQLDEQIRELDSDLRDLSYKILGEAWSLAPEYSFEADCKGWNPSREEIRKFIEEVNNG